MKIGLTLMSFARATSTKVVMHSAIADAHRDAARSASERANEPIDRTTKTTTSTSCDVTARVDDTSTYAGSSVDHNMTVQDGNCI